MHDVNGRTIAEKLDDTAHVTQVMREAVARAIWEHGRLGNPIATWEDGKVVVRHVTEEEMRRCEEVLGIERPSV